MKIAEMKYNFVWLILEPNFPILNRKSIYFGQQQNIQLNSCGPVLFVGKEEIFTSGEFEIILDTIIPYPNFLLLYYHCISNLFIERSCKLHYLLALLVVFYKCYNYFIGFFNRLLALFVFYFATYGENVF